MFPIMMLIMRLHRQHHQGSQLHSLLSVVCKMFFYLCIFSQHFSHPSISLYTLTECSICNLYVFSLFITVCLSVIQISVSEVRAFYRVAPQLSELSAHTSQLMVYRTETIIKILFLLLREIFCW